MTIDVLGNDNGLVLQAPITLKDDAPCRIHLKLPPGADAFQLVVREGDKVVAAIEVAAQSGEEVMLELRRDSAGVLQVIAPNRPYLVLPDEKPHPPRLLVPPPGMELDLAILVDGTCLHPASTPGTLDYLLSPAMAREWTELAGQLAEFASIISAKYTNVWTTTMAFGDEELPDLANSSLKPVYLIHPENSDERQLKWTPQADISAVLLNKLRKLPYTPGGDLVDGLADGLRACGELMWRQSSRKLLLIFGHSPGYSVLEPADEIANLVPRTICIEDEIAELHTKGVEVMTIFHHPDSAEERYSLREPAAIFRHSRRQYARIASLVEWSSDSEGLDVKGMASRWLNPPTVIARGPSPGFSLNP